MKTPVPYVPTLSARPERAWLKRAFTTLLIERRLPWRVSRRIDRLANAAGLRLKTIRAGGFRVRVRRLTVDEQFVSNVMVNREYTPPPFEIGESDVVIDIGANIGTFTLLASRQARKGKVLSFEPNGQNYSLLLQNLRLNRVTNVVPRCVAVSGHSGQVKMFWATQGGFHTMLDDRAQDLQQSEVIEALSLQAIFDEYGLSCCNFLKLDCEGAEYDILYGLPAAYFSRVEKIAMEYHGAADDGTRRAQSDGLVAFLEARGFRVDAYEEFVGFRGGFIRATNTAFVPQ